MTQKLLIKVGILAIALIMVFTGMSFFSSLEFKKSVGSFFGLEAKGYNWCPKTTIDMDWQDARVSEKWKAATSEQIQNRFCSVSMEPIQNVDLAKIVFKPLLKAQSATAQTAFLEWNPETQLFKAQGLPFYSPSLSQELLQK